MNVIVSSPSASVTLAAWYGEHATRAGVVLLHPAPATISAPASSNTSASPSENSIVNRFASPNPAV